MKTFEIRIRYMHRKVGPQGVDVKIDASSPSVAIGKALREFRKTLDRRERFDFGKQVDLRCVLVGSKIKRDAPMTLAEASQR